MAVARWAGHTPGFFAAVLAGVAWRLVYSSDRVAARCVRQVHADGTGDGASVIDGDTAQLGSGRSDEPDRDNRQCEAMPRSRSYRVVPADVFRPGVGSDLAFRRARFPAGHERSQSVRSGSARVIVACPEA